MKKVIGYICTGLFAIVIIALVLYTNYLAKEHYNTDYVNGNTAGNLYNDGLFCEYDDYIYFANPADSNRLYRMDKNGTNIIKLCDDSVAYINADENYIYYGRTGDTDESSFSFLHVNTHSLCKIRRDGKGNVHILDNDPVMFPSLVGNYIYYLHYSSNEGTTLYRVKIDGEKLEQVYPYPYYACSTNGQNLYYNGLESDHNIYKYDTATNNESLLYEGNCWMPIVEGNTAYFMDCDHDYQLSKVDLTTGEKITLTTDRIECYNVSNGVVYFQRNNDAALCSVRTDGSNYTVLKEGIFTDINVAGNKLYYRDFESDIIYQMALTGGPASIFSPDADN